MESEGVTMSSGKMKVTLGCIRTYNSFMAITLVNITSTPSYELEDFVVAEFYCSTHLPLLMATSAFKLGRRC